ncbi:MAG TPA: PilZ domain-containing protein [Gammaproteobacteria bacterium]|nr:PilZ domain-containing protein [Gammaproteobacteria bacterium]
MNTQDKDPEQRRFHRVPFDVDISLRAGGRQWKGKLIDVSLHGALIETSQDLPARKDEIYRLEIHLEGGPDIVMQTRIAHQESGRTGLACDDIDLESITHLRRLVELNLGDPALVERELAALGY